MRHHRWAPVTHISAAVTILVGICCAQNIDLPSDYAIDLQLGAANRAGIMNGNPEITGTSANQIGDEVLGRLTSQISNLPYQWQLTLVNDDILNARSTSGGKIYVDGAMLPVVGRNKGLWAAVLSHEAAHTARRHQVRVYLQQLYNARMIEYYRARAREGDKSANWALMGFAVASKIALKKLERDQEHDADQQGMLLMARAGYHPDFVFALHHILLMQTGEKSKFAAFFSDHPRWETRDQRSDKVYLDAISEFRSHWSDGVASPGGRPPVVAFLGQPEAKENREAGTADISLPMFCRNSDEPVDVVLMFQKDKHPVRAADPAFEDKDGNLFYREKADCLEKNETSALAIHLPAGAVAEHDRSLKAQTFIADHGQLIASSKLFDIHFPKSKKKMK